MIPILYAPNSLDDFKKGKYDYITSYGVGALSDCVNCTVTEERNGRYDCDFSYPINGIYFNILDIDYIIKIKPNAKDNAQLFRVYSYSKPINGIVKYILKHIRYDLNYYVLPDFKFINQNAHAALATALNYNYQGFIVDTGFSSYSDGDKISIAYNDILNTDKPITVGAMLGNNILNYYQDYNNQLEYHFNNTIINLLKNRGTDTGAIIQYGKNITDCNMDVDFTNVYTLGLPYCVVDGTTYYGDIKELAQGATYSFPRTIAIDVGRYVSAKIPTMAEVSRAFNDWSRCNPSPAILFKNLTVSFFPDDSLAEIGLCDIVTVQIDKYNINTKAKITKTIYDSLKERYTSIEIGNAKTSLSDIIIKR